MSQTGISTGGHSVEQLVTDKERIVLRRGRHWIAVAIMLLFAIAIAGCGGGGAANSGGSQTPPAQTGQSGGSTTPPAPAEPEHEGKVIVYSAISEPETVAMLEAFTAKTGIKAEFIRLSAGQINARVMAEKDGPQADVILGGPSENHMVLAAEGLLEAYDTPLAKDYEARFYDADHYWHGFYVGALGITVNTDLFEKDFPGVAYPETWDDLLNPAFKNSITIASPASSGTAYSFVATQIFRLGEDKAWAWFKDFDVNVQHYESEGAAPTRKVATGEAPIGMAFGHDIAKTIRDGYKVKLIYPPDTGWEIGGLSLIKGAPNPNAGRIFIDWMLGAEAGQLHTDQSMRLSARADVPPPQGSVTLDKIKLVNFDSTWAADNKKDVVEKFVDQFNK